MPLPPQPALPHLTPTHPPHLYSNNITISLGKIMVDFLTSSEAALSLACLPPQEHIVPVHIPYYLVSTIP